ncbi:unnamed protein product [Rotaria sp. Silwood2]|nr:unnamed protein product [Rotaria sp. Silwood2]CAF4319379.1 unnamed protein product [Rotaria sp. Silwood2]
MGCALTAMFGSYTEADIETEVANFTPHLSMAELMNGGIIKLEGSNGFFNPNSLLDPSWLKGKMTAEEYCQAINYVNKCTGRSQVGLTKAYPPSERAFRAQLRSQAGLAAVEEINKRYRSVRFTYQQTAQDMDIDISYSTDPAMRFAQRRGHSIGHASKTRRSTVEQGTPVFPVESAVQVDSDRGHTDKNLDDEVHMSFDDLFSDKELMLSVNDEDERAEQEINKKLASPNFDNH